MDLLILVYFIRSTLLKLNKATKMFKLVKIRITDVREINIVGKNGICNTNSKKERMKHRIRGGGEGKLAKIIIIIIF